MPQYNAPTLVTSVLSADIFLFWKSSLGKLRTVTFADLVNSVANSIPHVDSVTIISGNTTLTADYQFVVANSAGAFNITLPDAIAFSGRKFKIANKGAGTVSIIASGTDVISAGTLGPSTTIAQYNTYEFESDGVDTWFRTS